MVKKKKKKTVKQCQPCEQIFGVIAPRDNMYVLRYSCSTSIVLWEGVEILATFKVSHLLSIAKQDEISHNFY